MFPEYYQYLATTVKTLAEREAGRHTAVRTMAGGQMPSEMRR